MNSSQIEYAFQEDSFVREMWKGFLAPDIVLDGTPSPPFPHLYIVNTAPSYTPGEHWCVVFVFENSCEFFDTYGNTPAFFGLTKTIMKHCKRVFSNSQRIQSFFSLVCGHHCIYYASMRARGCSVSEILSIFTKDYRVNDDWVFNWVAQTYGREIAEIQF